MDIPVRMQTFAKIRARPLDMVARMTATRNKDIFRILHAVKALQDLGVTVDDVLRNECRTATPEEWEQCEFDYDEIFHIVRERLREIKKYAPPHNPIREARRIKRLGGNR